MIVNDIRPQAASRPGPVPFTATVAKQPPKKRMLTFVKSRRLSFGDCSTCWSIDGSSPRPPPIGGPWLKPEQRFIHNATHRSGWSGHLVSTLPTFFRQRRTSVEIEGLKKIFLKPAQKRPVESASELRIHPTPFHLTPRWLEPIDEKSLDVTSLK